MSEEKDGGPAFPSAADTAEGHQMKDYGMSLRDWFAGQVMAEITRLSIDAEGGWDAGTVAAGCYHLADAMLAERKKVKP